MLRALEDPYDLRNRFLGKSDGGFGTQARKLLEWCILSVELRIMPCICQVTAMQRMPTPIVVDFAVNKVYVGDRTVVLIALPERD